MVSDLNLSGIIIIFPLMDTLLTLLTLREKKSFTSVAEDLIPVSDWTLQVENVNLSVQLKFCAVQVTKSLGLTLIFWIYGFLSWQHKLLGLLCSGCKISCCSNPSRRLAQESVLLLKQRWSPNAKFPMKIKMIKNKLFGHYLYYAFIVILTSIIASLITTSISEVWKRLYLFVYLQHFGQCLCVETP